MVVGSPPGVVIDTNIVLDLLVFSDTASQALHQALGGGQLRWLATAAMRDELRRVLDYPQIAPRMDYHGLAPDQVLARFDAWVHTVAPAPRAAMVCKDADDQKFIDLAVAHRALLLSKDRAVLRLAKRLLGVGVRAVPQLGPADTIFASANGVKTAPIKARDDGQAGRLA